VPNLFVRFSSLRFLPITTPSPHPIPLPGGEKVRMRDKLFTYLNRLLIEFKKDVNPVEYRI
jgi:hypothetical protein